MVKSQRIKNKSKKPGPTIISERVPKGPPAITLDPKYANAPVRAVNFVEVGGMEPHQVQLMLNELAQMHDTARGGIHYFLPVRGGKIGSDIIFEEEWLTLIRQLCIVNEDGEIDFKDGASEVLVIRTKI